MSDADLGDIIQIFWREFDDFQTKQGVGYSQSYIWQANEIKEFLVDTRKWIHANFSWKILGLLIRGHLKKNLEDTKK